MSIKLDLSKFKHQSSDKHSTTLVHAKDGHTITLSHKGLSPDNQKALAALARMDDTAHKPSERSEAKQDSQTMMAKGGKVDKKKAPNTIVAAKGSHGVEAANELRKEEKVEHGATIVVPGEEQQQKLGKVKMMAEGGDLSNDEAVETADSLLPEGYNPPPREEGNIVIPSGQTPMQRDLAALGSGIDSNMRGSMGIPDAAAPMAASNTPPAHDPQADVKNADENAIAKAAAQNDSQGASKGADDPGKVPGAGELGIQQAANGDTMGTMQAGYANQMHGIQQEANAQGQLGKNQAAILGKQVEAQAAAKQAFEQSYKALDAERQAHIQDIRDGLIDPNKYWTGDKNGNGSHSKIASGIGMILAGFNPTDNPNAAINFLTKQMDMNLEAQKANLGAKQSLLNANLQQFHNMKDATDMTRLMQSDIVHNQLLSAAATSQSPLAKAAALKAAGDLQMKYAPLARNMALRTALTDGSIMNPHNPSDTSRAEALASQADVFDPELAKTLHAKIVPGVGVATQPVPEDVRQQMIMRQNFDKAASHYADWATKNAGSMNPAKQNEGHAIAAELQGMYRKATQGGVFKEGEQNFIERLVPDDPSQFAPNMRTLPKINALIQSNRMQLNGVKSGYGIPQTKDQPAPQTVERFDKSSGKTALFDAQTKKFLGYK